MLLSSPISTRIENASGGRSGCSQHRRPGVPGRQEIPLSVPGLGAYVALSDAARHAVADGAVRSGQR